MALLNAQQRPGLPAGSLIVGEAIYLQAIVYDRNLAPPGGLGKHKAGGCPGARILFRGLTGQN